MKFSLILFCLFPLLSLAQSSPDQWKEIAEVHSKSRPWKVLLHYRKTITGGFKSEADGPMFFFSEDGRRNPLSEMLASVAQFAREDIPVGANHPQCAFPARYKYLKKVFNLTTTDIVCEEHKWWRDNLPFT